MLCRQNGLSLALILIIGLFCSWVFVFKMELKLTTLSNILGQVTSKNVTKSSSLSADSSTPVMTLDCRSWTKVDFTVLENKADSNIEKQSEIENDANDKRHDILSKHVFVNFSGPGSTLQATKNFREGLAKIVEFIKENLNQENISILDSSCGDMVWMPTFLEGRSDIEYTGYDLLHENVDRANKMFTNKTWTFEEFDLVKDKIKTKFDLLINRHTAIHLGLRDNIQMFHNFYQSGSRYLLTTTFPKQPKNTALFLSETTRFHEVNLVLPPFQFPVPTCQSPDTEGSGGTGQFYALWEMTDLAAFNERNRDLIKSYEA